MASPIPLLEFFEQMAQFPFLEGEDRLAVAVSGGSDSLALLVLLKAWAESQSRPQSKTKDLTLVALIVDHRLRPNSSQEALQVLEWVTQLGIQGQILVWEGDKPLGGIQAKAREKRYELLATYCWRHGIQSLFLGHHQDDQLETFLLRREKQSLPYGLACMSPVSQRFGIRLLRPLLAFSKARLQATLTKEEIPWVEDPSNQERHFSRVRTRQHLATLPVHEKKGFLEEIQAFAFKRREIDQRVAVCLQQALQVFPEGHASLQLEAFQSVAPEIQSLVLQKVLRACGGQKLFFKQAQLEAWCQGMLTGHLKQVRTLGGCCLVEHKGFIWFYRELALVQKPCWVCPPGEESLSLIWDRRFYLELKAEEPLWLACLGDAGGCSRSSSRGSSRGSEGRVPFQACALASTPSPRFAIRDTEEGRGLPNSLLLRECAAKKRPEVFIDRAIRKMVFLGEFVLS